jgi:hypothetical protein
VVEKPCAVVGERLPHLQSANIEFVMKRLRQPVKKAQT